MQAFPTVKVNVRLIVFSCSPTKACLMSNQCLEELIDAAVANKASASALDKAGNYHESIECLKESAKYVLKAVCSGPEAVSRTELSDLDHAIKSDLAMVHYKIKDYRSAILYCDKALLRRKTMPGDLLEKTLYRKASAEYESCNYEECKAACEELLSEFPNNAAGRQLLQVVLRDLADEAKSGIFQN